jgi:hypothetical protein
LSRFEATEAKVSNKRYVVKLSADERKRLGVSLRLDTQLCAQGREGTENRPPIRRVSELIEQPAATAQTLILASANQSCHAKRRVQPANRASKYLRADSFSGSDVPSDLLRALFGNVTEPAPHLNADHPRWTFHFDVRRTIAFKP